MKSKSPQPLIKILAFDIVAVNWITTLLGNISVTNHNLRQNDSSNYKQFNGVQLDNCTCLLTIRNLSQITSKSQYVPTSKTTMNYNRLHINIH